MPAVKFIGTNESVYSRKVLNSHGHYLYGTLYINMELFWNALYFMVNHNDCNLSLEC